MRAETVAFTAVAALLAAVIAVQREGASAVAPALVGVGASAADPFASGHTRALEDLTKVFNPSRWSGRPPILRPIAATYPPCPQAPAQYVDGELRLALLVGVGAYRSQIVNDLSGPAGDVAKMKRLLAGEGGFGFPAGNVCVLVDADATRANFEAALLDWLAPRAAAAADIVIFFAGHGSQQRDLDNDESDGFDETLLFHDVGFRAGDSQPLIDDEFNALMLRLKGAASDLRITVILDACNSGTATRGPPGRFAVRAGPTTEQIYGGATPWPVIDAAGAEDSWLERAPGDRGAYTVLAAAADGSVALEFGAQAGAAGVFTDALFQVLSQGSTRRTSYFDIEPEVRRLVQARSQQSPRFYGSVDQKVFGGGVSRRLFSWRVLSVTGDGVARLGTGPLPGAGERAVFRIFDKETPSDRFGDPLASKAQGEVISFDGGSVEARLFAIQPGENVRPDDYAVLVHVGADFRKAAFRIRPASEPDGVPDELARKVDAAYRADARRRQLFVLSDALAPLELIRQTDGALALIDPSGLTRNLIPQDQAAPQQVLDAMELHARQAAIRQLSGDAAAAGGERLEAFVRPLMGEQQAPDDVCGAESAPGDWSPDGSAVARVPLCGVYELWVLRVGGGGRGEQVGGLFMAADGVTIALPTGRGCAAGWPVGAPIDVTAERPEVCLGTFQARPPIGVDETFMIFATSEDAPVRWDLLASGPLPQIRSGETVTVSPLARTLDDYVANRSRSEGGAVASGADRAYSVASLPIRVVPSTEF